ncbi:Uncharacterised protein [Mycobacteroides abscessus subsp. abscessus]|nr:Uncharacterised protein [Mycobacteroides abscessus subsp. abscessus]
MGAAGGADRKVGAPGTAGAEATGGSVAAAPRASAAAKSEHDAKRSAGRRAIAIAITGSRSARSGRTSASRGTTPLTR